jgi:hypothetical protein
MSGYPSVSDIAANEGVPSTSVRIVNQYTERVSETVVRYVTVYEITHEAKIRMVQDELSQAFQHLSWRVPGAEQFHMAVATVRFQLLFDGFQANSSKTFRESVRAFAEDTKNGYLHTRSSSRPSIDLSQIRTTRPIPFESLTLDFVPEQSGVYIFYGLGSPLYIGSAGNFRNRFERYLEVLNGRQNGEYGGEKLLAVWHQMARTDPQLFHLSVCFLPCAKYKDVEGALIHELEPPFNNKYERAGVSDNLMEWLRRRT